jgi:hypothetical protein
VLRPGGVGLTRELMTRAEVTDADVLEFAPGLGRTATEIIPRRPRSYVGQDPTPPIRFRIITGYGEVRVTDAADTGLPDTCTDVVLGEAMLSMQADTGKHAIVSGGTGVAAGRTLRDP